jgi:hypothetical protein
MWFTGGTSAYSAIMSLSSQSSDELDMFGESDETADEQTNGKE